MSHWVTGTIHDEIVKFLQIAYACGLILASQKKILIVSLTCKKVVSMCRKPVSNMQDPFLHMSLTSIGFTSCFNRKETPRPQNYRCRAERPATTRAWFCV